MKQLFLFVTLLVCFQLISQEQVNPPAFEASYIGGSQAMNAFLAKNLTYPKGKTKEGIVYVEFIVEKDGKVTSPKALRGISPEFDNIALNAVSKMPNWTPAKDDVGNPVQSKMVLPIKFKK